MSYLTYSFNLTDNQKKKLANAYNNKKAVNIKLKYNQLTGDFPIMITKRQQNKINKVKKDKLGFILRMSELQVKNQSKNGGFLGALAGLFTRTILPLVSKVIPKIIAPLATGALTTVGDVAMKKIMGTGMINVPNDKKIDLLKTNALTKNQIKKIKNSSCDCSLKLTKKQLQNGGFLGLLASLGIPLITSLISGLTGKGLQIGRPKGNGLQIGRPKGNGLQIGRPKGNGLQIGRPRNIPFNTGEGLQIEPSSDDDTIDIDKIAPNKKHIGIRCNVYNDGAGLQIQRISKPAGAGLQIRTRKRNRHIKCEHIYGSGNCNSNCHDCKKKS